MKKSLVAVSIVIAIGAVWVGGSWYTGKIIETEKDRLISNANAKLAEQYPAFGLKLALTDFKRGLFSSSAKYTLTTSHKDYSDYKLSFVDTIYHGPFPLSQVMKFNLVPRMASISTTLEKPSENDPVFAITNGAPPFSAQTNVSYSKNFDTSVKISPINYQNDKVSIDTGNALLDMSFTNGQKDSTGDLSIGNISIVDKEENTVIVFSDNVISSELNDSNLGFSLGHQKWVSKNFSIGKQGNSSKVFSIDNFVTDVTLAEATPKSLNVDVSYSFDALNILSKNFGSGQFAINFKKLDAKSIQNYIDEVNKLNKEMLENNGDFISDEYQAETMSVAEKTALSLLQHNPEISIAPLSLKNDKGESTYTLDIKFQPEATAANNDKIPEVFRIFKDIKMNLTLSKPMVTELMTQSLELKDSLSREEAAQMAESELAKALSMIGLLNLVTIEDKKITMNFNYADGMIELNKSKFEASTLIQQMSMLMGLGGGINLDEYDDSDDSNEGEDSPALTPDVPADSEATEE